MGACPTISELESYASGGGAQAEFAEHIAICVSCAERLREIERDNAFLAEVARHASIPASGGRSETRAAIDAASIAAVGPMAGAAMRPARPDAGSALPLEMIPGYEMLRVIGRGGQAVVYEALQISTHRRVALKVLLYGSVGGVARAARFAREIRVVAQLRHPGVVTIFDSGVTADGRPFFAMEYIVGEPIHQWVQRRQREHSESPRDSVRHTLILFTRVCEAVRHAHQHGVIHRDLKPSNILVDAEGQPHVLDFGLAKIEDATTEDFAEMTTEGQFLGTIAYAASEQVRGDPHLASTRTDVYALGAILYELLTQRGPVPMSGSVSEVIEAIATRPPDRPSMLREGIDGELETIVLKALAKEPERRYEGAGALLDDLSRYLAGEAITAKRDSAWYVMRKTMRRHRLPVAVISGFVMLSLLYAVTMSLLYSVAAVRGDRARELAAERQRELSASQIERGRQLAIMGSVAAGHDLIWSEHRRQQAALADTQPPRRDSEDPIERQAYWALWQVYQGSPMLFRASVTDEGGLARGIAVGHAIVSAHIDAAGRLHLTRRSANDGSVIAATSIADAMGALHETTYGVFSEDAARMMWMNGSRHRCIDVVSGGVLLDEDFGSESSVMVFAGQSQLARIPSRDPSHVEVRDLANGKIVRVLRSGLGVRSPHDEPQDDPPLQFLDASADGDIIVAGVLPANGDTTRASVIVWHSQRDDPISIQNVTVKPLPFRGRTLIDVRISPSGRFLATLFGHTLDVWDARTLRWLHRPGHDSTWALSCWLSPDTRWLATIELDHKIQLWQVFEGVGSVATRAGSSMSTSKPRIFAGHSRRVWSIGWMRGTDSMASIDRDGTIIAWDLRHSPELQSIKLADASFHLARFDPHAEALVIGGLLGDDAGTRGRGMLTLWNPSTGDRHTLSSDGGLVSDALYIDGPAMVLASSHDGTMRCLDATTGATRWEAIAPAPTHLRSLNKLTLSPDQRTVAAACNDGSIHLWGAATGEYLRAYVHTPARDSHMECRVPSAAFSPDGLRLASAGVDKLVKVWTLADGDAIELIGHEATVRAIAFHPTRNVLASGEDAGVIRLWNPQTGDTLGFLPRMSHAVFALAFSPDGYVLASGTADGIVTLWDIESHRELLRLGDSSDGMTFSVDFSPDGNHLAAAQSGGVVRVWNLSHFDRHMRGNAPKRP